jgi:hypothetical protein
MIDTFKKYDKKAQRTVCIETETFNKILAEANAAVRVIPRDVEMRNRYVAYEQNCKETGEVPMSEFEYSKTYPYDSCCFEVYENAPAKILISKALGVQSVSLEYAKDYYGRMTNDELEVTYHIA